MDNENRQTYQQNISNVKKFLQQNEPIDNKNKN